MRPFRRLSLMSVLSLIAFGLVTVTATPAANADETAYVNSFWWIPDGSYSLEYECPDPGACGGIWGCRFTIALSGTSSDERQVLVDETIGNGPIKRSFSGSLSFTPSSGVVGVDALPGNV